MLAPMLRATTKSTIAKATSTPITRLNMLMKWVSCLLTDASRESRTRSAQYNGLGEGFVNRRSQSVAYAIDLSRRPRRFAASTARHIARLLRDVAGATILRAPMGYAKPTGDQRGTMSHPANPGALACALLLATASSAATPGWPAPGPMPPPDNQRLARDIFKQIVEIRSVHALGTKGVAEVLYDR